MDIDKDALQIMALMFKITKSCQFNNICKLQNNIHC